MMHEHNWPHTEKAMTKSRKSDSLLKRFEHFGH